jgi:hypothetical protein
VHQTGQSKKNGKRDEENKLYLVNKGTGDYRGK